MKIAPKKPSDRPQRGTPEWTAWLKAESKKESEKLFSGPRSDFDDSGMTVFNPDWDKDEDRPQKPALKTVK